VFDSIALDLFDLNLSDSGVDFDLPILLFSPTLLFGAVSIHFFVFIFFALDERQIHNSYAMKKLG